MNYFNFETICLTLLKKNNMKKFFLCFSFIFGLVTLISCGSNNSINDVELIPVKQSSDGDWQYVDKTGKVVINPQFSEASIFRDGIALVKTSSKEINENPQWGFIKEDGQFAFNTKYLRATVFSEDLAFVVAPNGAPTAINTDGEIKFTLQNAEHARVFKNGMAAFSENDSTGEKWGFVGTDGTVKINPQFREVGFFNDGLCPVKNEEGKWGYIDESGTIVINYQFDRAVEFKRSFAVVVSEGKCGIIDEKGKFKINPQYQDLWIDEKVFVVRQDDKYGWVDDENKFTANPQFSRMLPFNSNDVAPVKSGKTWGFANQESKLIINTQFDEASTFNNGIAMVRNGSNWGAVDNEGKFVINPQFAELSDDYLIYVNAGRSDFEEVTTDYFNVGAIAGAINLDQPEGLKFGVKYSDLFKKLNLDSNVINTYNFNGSAKLYDKKINEDALLTLEIASSNLVSQRMVQDPSGFYEFPEKFVDYNAMIEGYFYTITLMNKGDGREQNLFDELSKSIAGFTKDVTDQKFFSSYSKGKRKILIGIIGKNQVAMVTIDKEDVILILTNYFKEMARKYALASSSKGNDSPAPAVPAGEFPTSDSSMPYEMPAAEAAPASRYRNDEYAVPAEVDPDDVGNW